MTIRHVPTPLATASCLALACLLAAACATQGTTPKTSRHTTPQAVLTTPLTDAAWQSSQWIAVADAPVVSGPVDEHRNGRAADGASWFVSTVRNEQRVTSARWMTTALGIYELFVNGQSVGKEILKPGFTHPTKTRRSFTYDITPLLKKRTGECNELAIQVTPGWWADKIVTPSGHEGMVGGKCAFRGVLELTYADGSRLTYPTDLEHWRATIAGPVTHAAIFDGEEYDARQQFTSLQPSQFSVPEVSTAFSGDILPTSGAEVYLRHDLALQPVRAYVWHGVSGASEQAFGRVNIIREYRPDQIMTLHAGETLVVDFGQNCAAVPAFTFKATEGTVLTCLPAELLNDTGGAFDRGMDGPEGSCHRANLRIPQTGMSLVYTFADSPSYVRFLPRATFFGYRYLSITATNEVCIRSLQSIPVTSIAQNLETGTLNTGHALVNQLISNTIWGLRSNYLSIPTDCPQRNERLGWTADTQVFAETGTFFADTRQFFHKWMRDLRDSQNEHGGFPGVAPTAQYGGECMRVGWADAGIIVPWTIWKQFADTAIIAENWTAMERFMSHVHATQYRHEALLAENGNYQWADWLSFEPLESSGGSAFSSSGPLPEAVDYWNFLSSCFYALDADMMADMAHAIGRDATPYSQMAAEARYSLRTHFLHPDGTFQVPLLNTMQTPALFALRCHLVDGQARQLLTTRLRQNIVLHGNCLQTGFLGTSILLPTLTDNGMADLAYELLLQHSHPSWLYSVDNGATTIWERWNSYTTEHGMGPQGMNSFNHYAYGVVCQWLWEHVAGIAADPSQPGFTHIIMKPIPDKRLGHVIAHYQSAAGLIKSTWRYKGDRWIWQFTIPKGATASVTIPGENTSREYSSGTYKVCR